MVLSEPEPIDLPQIPFPMSDIYRRIGMPEHEVAKHEGIAHALDEALDMARPLIHPRAVCHVLKIQDAGSPVRFAESSFLIDSRQVANLLRPCSFAVLFMCTIGQALENRSLQASEAGDMTLAFFLDAIASETADAAADDLHRRYFKAKAAEKGYAVTPRFSPGYGDWPITVQSAVHELCRGERIGISLTPTSLMIPRKSVSAVFGLKLPDTGTSI